MKKIFLLLTLLLCFSLLGCANSNGANDVSGDLSQKIKELEEKIVVLENENAELKEKIENSEPVETTLAELESKEDNAEVLKVGDIITTDRMEITVKKIELTYKVLPDDTSGFYTHYPADSGHVYIHIDTDIKNIQKQDLGCDDLMVVEADYNDGFTYNSMTIPEDSNTGFTYANITLIKPLETRGVRFLIDCPQEVEETDNSLFLIFKVDKKEFKYIVR